MQKIIKFVATNLEEIVISILFVNMCVFVLIQIVSRYIFHSPILYSEEMARYSYVWVCFFGMGVATKLQNHIKIDLLFLLLRGKAQVILKFLINILSLFLYTILLIIGYNYTLINVVQVSPAMEISKAIVYVSLPLGALFSIIRLIMIIKNDIVEGYGEKSVANN